MSLEQTPTLTMRNFAAVANTRGASPKPHEHEENLASLPST
jgi:hypothetical protein